MWMHIKTLSLHVSRHVCFAALIWSSIVFFASCRPTPVDCRAFFDLGATERKQVADSNSTQANFDLLRCRDYVHSSFHEAADAIVHRGEASVAFLLEKLDETKDEDEQERAIALISSIDSVMLISGRSEVIEHLDRTISGMKTEIARASSTTWLEQMKSRDRK